MDKIIEEFVKLIPLAPIFEQWGMTKEGSTAVSFILLAIAVYGLIHLFKFLLNGYKNEKTAKDLAPHFDYQKVKMSRDLFIPTQWQQFSPTHEEEPSFSGSYVTRAPLIPHFLNNAFDEKKDSQKFYLVLADSGMGKTTFMINLYVQYNSFFNFNKKYKIKLLPFGDTRILEHIKEIKPEEAKNTILLLDAFDEYKGLLPPEVPDGLTDEMRFRKKLDEIIETVRDFREVVITSRTQYFPGQEHKPYELNIPRFDDKGFHTLAKLYISPFNNKEIKRYLNKKYGVLKFWNWKKKEIAHNVVHNSPKLMVRPMLLSYIDYLVDRNRIYKNTYDIYDTLIEKWIEREANKRKHETTQREQFKNDLYSYSRFVALEIYNKRKETGLLYLPKSDVVEVAEKNFIGLRDYEITGQSLLTRDADYNWKFAHKSIFEFFIAKEATTTTDMTFLAHLDFTGMDMAKTFFMSTVRGFVHIKGGTFLMGSTENEPQREAERETQHSVKVNDFFMLKHPVTIDQFENFIQATDYKTDADKGGGSNIWDGKKWVLKPNINWRCDVKGDIQMDKNHPVIHVSWNDVDAYCQWLSKDSHSQFRLPTEAEWEYACRAGTTTPFNTGDNLTTVQANYNGDFPYNKNPKGKFLNKTTPVGNYDPNAWGLYDMHGNVWEWCGDWYSEKFYDECKKMGVADNPICLNNESTFRVLRGGSWDDRAQSCRSARRGGNSPAYRNFNIGFRLVFVP